ncbi:SDR family oxidoreductase [Lactococcus formosensis subsp. formosensis]|uniref:SDR family oxidoreductase n=1 Tax=Lactococcus formosensis TaxID=1281486 RepID=UPI0031333A2E
MLLQNKVALITGGSRGIGAIIASRFAKEGAFVIVNYLQNSTAAEALVKQIRADGGKALAYQSDIRNPEKVDKMIEEILNNLRKIDILVNNALTYFKFNPKTRKMSWEIDWTDYQAQLAGGLKAAVNLSHLVVPSMKQQFSGRIINMSSNLVASPIIPYHDYIVAKAALQAWTKTMAKELGAFGIQVNAISPGLTYPTASSIETHNDIREDIISNTPTGRLTTPNDIAGTALFLASDLSSNITGQNITVDGGLTMNF